MRKIHIAVPRVMPYHLPPGWLSGFVDEKIKSRSCTSYGAFTKNAWVKKTDPNDHSGHVDLSSQQILTLQIGMVDV